MSRLVTLFLLCFLFTGSQALAQQPNIVFIISDDAGFADWGFMDAYTQSMNPGQAASPVPTPNLDRLRDRGVLFTNAYTAAVCSPSRAAILTGSYQQRVGYEFNINNLTSATGNFEGLKSEDVTIFERMGARGYSTGAIGKWHVGGIPDIVENGVVTKPGNRPPRQGVDEFFGVLRGSRSYPVGPLAGDVTRALREMSLGADGLEINNDIEAAHAGEYVTNTFGQGAVDFIDRHYADSDPFFLYVSFTAPHSPLGPSPDRNEPGVSSDYGSMMFTMDKEIGRIMDKIEDPAGDGSADLTDDTLIIFINDNGGAQGGGRNNLPLRNYKGSTYEGGIRVPMIFAGAGVTASPGSVYAEPVHSIDVLATCHELAGGVPLDNEIDGVNLLPFVNGIATGVPHESIVIRSAGKYGIRVGDWKLTRNGTSAPELYDLSTNISEASESDLAASNPSVVENLLQVLTEHEVGFDKPRFHGLNASADSINRNDAFRFAPFPQGGGNFTPDLVLIAPGTRNGGFESPAFGTDQHSYAEADEWTNIGSGTQDEAFIRTNLGRATPQNAVISENGARVAAIDTGHTLASGEMFRLSYWWRDASGWNDAADRIGFTFYTTADDTMSGAVISSTLVLSELSSADSSYEFSEGLYTATASETGKRLFVSFTGIDGNGATSGFARLDDVSVERGTPGVGPGLSMLNWSDGAVWIDSDTDQSDTLLETDAFAGAVLEFPISAGFSYEAINDMKRPTGEDFMLNQVILSGSSADDMQSARITGNRLLFTPSLDDAAATIENNADGGDFSYTIETPIIPWEELVIGGDGTANLTVSGEISDYSSVRPASLTKQGTSTLSLTGSHPFSGICAVEQGILRLESADLSGVASLSIANGATLAGMGTIAGDVLIEGTLMNGLGAGEQIDVAGDVNLAGANLELVGTFDATPTILVSYTTLSGVFASISGLPAGATIDYAFNGNQIAIVPASDPYTHWAEIISGLSGADAAFDADSNEDGVTNGIAFFLGAANANLNARHLLPTVTSAAGVASFTFSIAATASDYPFQIRYSTDLDEWESLTDGQDGVSISIDNGQVLATIPHSLAVSERLFLRLSIPTL